MVSMLGSTCKYEFCWLCLCDYGQVCIEGNVAHEKDCQHYRAVTPVRRSDDADNSLFRMPAASRTTISTALRPNTPAKFRTVSFRVSRPTRLASRPSELTTSVSHTSQRPPAWFTLQHPSMIRTPGQLNTFVSATDTSQSSVSAFEPRRGAVAVLPSVSRETPSSPAQREDERSDMRSSSEQKSDKSSPSEPNLGRQSSTTRDSEKQPDNENASARSSKQEPKGQDAAEQMQSEQNEVVQQSNKQQPREQQLKEG